MIVVDIAALMAILLDETEAEPCIASLGQDFQKTDIPSARC